MLTFIVALLACLRAALIGRTALALENAALRQQLTIYQRNQKRLRVRSRNSAEPQLWISESIAVQLPAAA